MSLSLTDYRSKLITKIMFAGSQEEVKRFIDTAMKSLEQQISDEYTIACFVNKTIDELELFSPMNNQALQWSNIKMARISFNKIKRKSEAAPLH